MYKCVVWVCVWCGCVLCCVRVSPALLVLQRDRQRLGRPVQRGVNGVGIEINHQSSNMHTTGPQIQLGSTCGHAQGYRRIMLVARVNGRQARERGQFVKRRTRPSSQPWRPGRRMPLTIGRRMREREREKRKHHAGETRQGTITTSHARACFSESVHGRDRQPWDRATTWRT
jgi:hypothetical protein